MNYPCVMSVFLDDRREQKHVTEQTSPLQALVNLIRDTEAEDGFVFVEAECHLKGVRQWHLKID